MSWKYQNYPKQIDSGVAWLGKIPAHWRVQRLGRFFQERREKVSDKKFPALSVTMQGIVPQLDTAAKTDDGDNRKLVLKDDFVINSRSDRKGSSGVSAFDGSVSLISIVMKPTNILPRFAHHLLRSYPFQEEFYRYGKGIVADLWSTNATELKNIMLPEIPIDEQLKIANFLDYELVRIDRLIEKQQLLIKLLKEKRQSVISHAVTKGLNSKKAFKDSGFNWLGQIPANWDICMIKYKCQKITDGAHVSPETEGGEKLFVSIADIKKGIINFENALLTTKRSYDYLVKTGCKPASGDILFSKDGTIGQTAITPTDVDFVVASSLIIIRPKKEILPTFFEFLLQSDMVKEQVESFVKGAALRRLSIQNLLKVYGVFPNTIEEQEGIVKYLSSHLLKFDELELKAQRQIELLRERRIALISSAVTGKIDVRNWQSPKQKENQPQDNKEVTA